MQTEKNIKRLIQAGIKVDEFNTDQINQMGIALSFGIDPIKHFANPKCPASTMAYITLSLLKEDESETEPIENNGELIFKTTQGYIEQVFEADSGKFISSRFVAEGECYYTDENFEIIESNLFAPFNCS